MPDFSFKDNKAIPIIVLILIGLSIYAFNKMSKNSTLSDEIILSDNHLSEKSISPYIFVDIDGAVKKSGVYSLKSGSRLIDLVKLAGGMSRYADINDINLAEILKDGQKIKIPYLGNDVTYSKDRAAPNNKIISLNNANENQLDTLPGIGASTAKQIIGYRNQNGAFKQIEELKNVPGIGESKFEKLRKLISL